MGQKFYTLLTQQGAALLANATALGIPLKLSKMAVGDANGNPTTPDASQTKLVHEVYQAPLNSLNTDEKNPNQIIAELVIPENQGGWFINEIGLYDENDTLVAVGNCPATYKPQLSEGSGRTQVIRMIIMVDNVNAVALKIDPSVVLAPRQYVNDLIAKKIANHEQTTNHPNATTNSKGFVQLNSAIDSNLENQAATPFAVKKTYNLITETNKVLSNITDRLRYLNDSSQLSTANKRYVFVIRDDASAGVFDTVNNRFVWSFNNDGLCTGYVDSSSVGGLDQFVKDRTTPVGVPMPWPQIHPPTGYFECNGAEFDRNQFQKLATAYPSGKLPDLRGEFIRGWDNAGGVDPNRKILDWQQDAIRNIWGRLSVVGRSAGQGPIEAEGVFRSDSRWNASVKKGNSDDWGRVYSFNASRVVPVANENRPRNIAFMYIVKAE
jgi:Phage-related tail fibre protein